MTLVKKYILVKIFDGDGDYIIDFQFNTVSDAKKYIRTRQRDLKYHSFRVYEVRVMEKRLEI